MKPEDYAWNTHEREIYENGQVSLPSPYKLKILDDSQKRLELEQILAQLPQKQLAQWVMEHAIRFIALIDIGDDLKKQQILSQVQEVFEARLAGNVSAYELRKAGFLAQQLSQQAKSPVSKYATRVFAQTVATAHMRGHAIVSADYAVKVVKLLSQDDIESVRKEREKQIASAIKWQKSINEL
ncbi:MAG: putative immunity protein [Streptococcus gordonii]